MKDSSLPFMKISRPALLALVIVLLTLALYTPATKGPFFSDDVLYIKGNQTLQGIPLAEVWKIFTGMTNRYEYLPLRDLSYRIDMALFGLDPVGYHIVNFLLYGLVCLSLWHLSISLHKLFHGPGDGQDRMKWFALIVTTLFATHPAHVESVVWISGRKDLLSALFALLAYWQFTKALLPGGLSPRRIFASYLLFLLALLSKSTVVPFSALAFLVAYIGLRRERPELGRLWKALIISFPFMALAVGSVLTQVLVGSKTGVYSGPLHAGGSMIGYSELSAKILGHFTRIAFAPYGMRLTYDMGTHGPLAVSLGISTIIVAGASLVYLIRRRSMAAFGIITFALFSLPFLQLVPFDTMSYVHERFLFMPLLGVAIFMAAFLSRLRFGVRLVYPAALAVLLIITFGRTLEWRSADVLILDNALRSPRDHHAVVKAVASVLVPEGRYAEAKAMTQNVRDKLKRATYMQFIKASEELQNGRMQSLDERRSFLEHAVTPGSYHAIHLLIGILNEVNHDRYKAAKYYYSAWRKSRFIDSPVKPK